MTEGDKGTKQRETRETEKKQRETERAMGGLLGLRSVLLGISLGKASGAWHA